MCVHTHIHMCYTDTHTICLKNEPKFFFFKSWLPMGKEETDTGIKVRFSQYTWFYSYDFGTM